MKELNDIIRAYDKAVSQNKQTALATVVKVEGSSYRRPGARMLVTDDGEITGAISGGCLEGDALRKALFAMNSKQNKLVIYDTTDDDDLNLGIQLGCNGIVYILFEPIDSRHENNQLSLLKKITQQRKDAVLITVFNEDQNAPQAGTCCFINEDERYGLHEDVEDIITDSHLAFEQRNSVVKRFADLSVLYQFIPPALQMVIAGAGNDAQPLVEMGALLNWNIYVVDGRATHATQRRFIKAHKVIVAKPAEVLRYIQTDAQTAFVLMTHNYNYDLALLEQLIMRKCAYIGVLGPQQKLHRMLGELHKRNLFVTGEQLDKIHGPAGLDIGAETAEEIAVSIIAEIKAVLSKRQGEPLRKRKREIHERANLRHE